MAAQFGTAPGSLSRFVNGLVSPVVPWTQVLRSWLREQCCDDWNWLEPALEYDGSGFILPSLKSEKMGAVVFGSDWSGSTYGELIEMFHVEKQACLDDMRPSRLVDLAFDTRVISAREYVPGDQIDPEIKGGGGTDFRPLIAHCEAMQPAPKCVVVLTDLDGAFPDESPSFPVIWVTFGQTAKAPFGEVIRAGGDV
jgi:predicted metal-dependent peptidase